MADITTQTPQMEDNNDPCRASTSPFISSVSHMTRKNAKSRFLSTAAGEIFNSCLFEDGAEKENAQCVG